MIEPLFDSHFFRMIMQLAWPLLALASVAAGILFVRAAPQSYNWCFLIGSAIQFLNGFVNLFIPMVVQSRGAEELQRFLAISFGIGFVGGLLVAYGIIGHAISYARIVSQFREG